jgi:retinol dehydrogenase-12
LGGARVVWVASLLNLGCPEGGVSFDKNGNPKQLKSMENYMQSKAGVYFLSHEFAAKSGGVYHVVSNMANVSFLNPTDWRFSVCILA